MKTILVTAFDPFNQESINPSSEALALLPECLADVRLFKLVIPTIQGKSFNKIKVKIEEVQPDVVVSIGQAGGRPDLSIERIGINLDDYRIKDNEGNQPIDCPIFEEGPAAYFSTLPIKAMMQACQQVKIPVSISNSAGTFVCNHVLYSTLHYIAENDLKIKAGFIHIPYLPQQVLDKPQQPSMTLEDIVVGITACLEAIIRYEQDIKWVGGSLQ